MVLTAINQYPTKAYAGLLKGINDAHDVRSYINNAIDVAGVYTLPITSVNSHTYTLTVYGIPVSFTSTAANTIALTQAGFVAAFAAIPALTPLIVLTTPGNNLVLTEVNPENGPANLQNVDASLSPVTNTALHSQLEPMPAGIMVYHGPNYQDARLPRAAPVLGNGLGSMAGVTLHQQAPINEKLFPPPSTVNFPSGKIIPVIKRGQIYVVTEQQVSLTSTPFFRFAADANGSQLGAFRQDNSGGNAATLLQAGFSTARYSEVISATLACLDFSLLQG